jgi:hypothetical protein
MQEVNTALGKCLYSSAPGDCAVVAPGPQAPRGRPSNVTPNPEVPPGNRNVVEQSFAKGESPAFVTGALAVLTAMGLL